MNHEVVMRREVKFRSKWKDKTYIVMNVEKSHKSACEREVKRILVVQVNTGKQEHTMSSPLW